MIATAPSVPLRALALWFVAALLLPYAGIALQDFDDIEDAALPWGLFFFYAGPVVALLHAWLIARLDRRLIGPSQSRSWAFLEGIGVAGTAICLPVVLHGMALVMYGVLDGRWRHVERSLLAIPFALGLALAGGAWLWARARRGARVARAHDRGTFGDIVPTAWLWTAWLVGTTGIAGIATATAASESTVGAGLALLGAWIAVSTAASVAIGRGVSQLPDDQVALPAALGREAAGATAVGFLLPVFLVGLLPGWDGADDTRWALLLGTLVAVPLAVWTQATGRVTRWARWT